MASVNNKTCMSYHGKLKHKNLSHAQGSQLSTRQIQHGDGTDPLNISQQIINGSWSQILHDSCWNWMCLLARRNANVKIYLTDDSHSVLYSIKMRITGCCYSENIMIVNESFQI